VIQSFRHKGLRRLYEDDDARGVPADRADKLRRMLARLDAATIPEDMNLPGYRLHSLKGALAGMFAADVSGNVRLVFRFETDGVHDVDLVDYH